MSFNKDTGLYEGYIYLVTNNVNGLQYVGQTRDNLAHRWKQHQYTAKYNLRTNRLYNAMNMYGVESFSFSQIKKIQCDDVELLKRALNVLEKYYILKYNTLSPDGYNLTKGGDARSEDALVRVDAYYANGDLYKEYPSVKAALEDVWSGGNSNHIPACCRGKALSAYGFIWRYHGDPFDKYPVTITQEYLNRDSRKVPVKQYTTDGKYLRTYDSLREAYMAVSQSKSVVGYDLRLCCEGKKAQAFGFVWRFKDDSFDKYIVIHKKKKPVNMYSKELVFEKSFCSIAEALSYLSVTAHGATTKVSECCKGKRKSAYGHIWFYADDPNQPDKTKARTLDVENFNKEDNMIA